MFFLGNIQLNRLVARNSELHIAYQTMYEHDNIENYITTCTHTCNNCSL